MFEAELSGQAVGHQRGLGHHQPDLAAGAQFPYRKASLNSLMITVEGIGQFGSGEDIAAQHLVQDMVGVSPCSGCETGHSSPPFALRSATAYLCPGRPVVAVALHTAERHSAHK